MADEEEELPGGHSPNTRPSIVKRFLAKPPRHASELVLTAAIEGSEQMQLGQWERDEIKPDIADEIIDSLKSYAEGMNGEARGLLTYKRADGQVAGKQMPVKCTPDSMRNASADLLQTDASELNGSNQSQARQAQRFAEASYQMSLRTIATVLQQMREITEYQNETMRTMAEALSERRQAADEQKQRADELETTLATMEDSQGGDSQVSASQARILQIVESVAPVVIAKLMGGGGTPPAAGG